MPPHSRNFLFLTECDPELARLGALAEWAFHQDAPTALGKLRQFAEHLAKSLAARSGLALDRRANLDETLRTLQQEGRLPRQAGDVLHFLRRAGNAALHENVGTPQQALTGLKLAHQLGVWLVRVHGAEQKTTIAPFSPPEPPRNAAAELAGEIERLRARLAASESEAERARREAAEAARARLDAESLARREAEERAEWERLATEEASAREDAQRALDLLRTEAQTHAPAQLASLQQAAETADANIEMDEADTRVLIDSKLAAAGWTVDSATLRYARGARPGDAAAIAIAEWPTATGPVDYALFIDGRCVGLIEAKRASRNVPAVLAQTARYAAGVELSDAQRLPPEIAGEAPGAIPFLFAANGRPYVKQMPTLSGVWFRDARREFNPPAPLSDWFSPQDLKEKLAQVTDAASLAAEPFDYAGLYPFQQEAVVAIEEAIGRGQRDILVAMATGTGKTRTCIALMYRLLKHKRFRRILFLVDRNALGEQTLRALANTELEGLLKFSESYNVAGLEKRLPEKEDRVHVATVQAMVKRVLSPDGEEDRPTPGVYDCIVVDEAHRGYTLDAELREEDLEFRSLDDYLSKYRRVLDYFDATKIALTATPALHTAEIFGAPVYRYGYRQAVVDGYLIDHAPPRRIKTALALAGITFAAGEDVEIIDPRTGQIDLFQTPDQVAFEVQEFNKKVYSIEFNRVVAEAVAAEIPPTAPGKTLLFAARDDHADTLVEELRAALEAEYGPQPHDLVQKITGKVDRPGDHIRAFRNDPRPKYVVTVDLLTTGVDVPDICNLVFVRRVNSRILYDQMIGRATRLSPAIGKEIFRIFDAVDIYANLQTVTDMRPVVVDPNIPLETLLTDLQRAPTDEDRSFVRDEILVRLRRAFKHLTEAQTQAFERAAGMPPRDFLARLRAAPPHEAPAWLQAQAGALAIAAGARPAARDHGVFISTHADELVAVEDVFAGAASPEDFISAFERFVRENMNASAAMIAATQRPRELTRKELKSLAAELDEHGFSEASLRRAYGRARNADIAAHIIGFVRQAALGDPLVPYAARVDSALAKIEASKSWTQKQKQWLRRIGRVLEEQPVGDRAILAEPAFAAQGGYETVNAEFDHRLQDVLADLNEAIWGRAS
ncbi:MAG TPA: type I restriction-modification system endonuclease [Methylosinus sp.]|uniref:type I restriction-modification system endonuclease n=1 Tax=Methylosinus sp. TaxID=427 RepID=UPI002F94DCCA